jgi:ABC-type multidrug transport system fused ATPase/permease subunit
MFCTNCASEIPLGAVKCPTCNSATDNAVAVVPSVEWSPRQAQRSHLSDKRVPEGATTLFSSESQARNSHLFDALNARYKDAYKAARFIVGLGRFIKGIALFSAIVVGVIAAVLLLAVIGAASDQRGGGAALIVGSFGSFAVALGGIVWALIAYVIGVFVSAAGQIQRATLDTAVNSSPHLTNGEKASIMSLV